MNAPLRRAHAPVCFAVIALCIPDFGNAQTPAKPGPPATPTVTGTFTGNGKPAALKFVVVEELEPFNDEPAIRVIFSEIDPSKSKKPSFDALFGKLGNSLTLSIKRGGDIFGCEVSHGAHEKRGFSSIGTIKTTGFKIAGGNVSGNVTTNGEQDAFGEKWNVDLNFAAPLPEKLRNAPAEPAKKETAEATDGPTKAPAMPAGPAISATTLPIPDDATDVGIKKLVQQIHFSSPRAVGAVTKEMSANLDQQGWQKGAGNLETKANAILKREQGAAKLTIMIQPAGTGSTVKIFTEGMDWSDMEESAAPATTGNTAKGIEDAAGAIEAEARKLLNDALKNLPK
jgi:hypothetical protein